MVHQRKRPGLDDVFLIISTIFLIAGTTTLLIWLDTLYLFQFVILNGVGALDSNGITTLLNSLVPFEQLDWAYFTLTWGSIFFIKFSFLTFFSGLCDRLPRMELYRKVVYGTCVVTFIYCILSDFVVCPHLGIEECKLRYVCLYNSG